MRDRIILEGLRVDAMIGVYPHEERVHQRLDIDVVVETDMARAASDDDVRHTIDYDVVARIARERVQSRHHRLIETLAHDIAEALLTAFVDQTDAVTVRIKKPGAVREAANVMVEARRTRADGPRERVLELGAHRLRLGGRAYVMGVVNATPDSFYDKGKFFDARDPGPAIARAEVLVGEGADVIDVGGETAQPTSPVLEVAEEISRVVPVIRALASRLAVPISVDTYKPEVARAAVEAGASLINDTSGLADPRLADVAAQTGAGLVCMHIPCHPKERKTPGYAEPVRAISEFLRERTDVARRAGVRPTQLMVDPGIGFGKTASESLALTGRLSGLRQLGYPVLYACSRRTFLGDLMGGLPADDRLEPTVAVNAVAILQGADMVRVHDVRFFARLVKMLELVRAAS
jgi:dihydropteroate synthase